MSRIPFLILNFSNFDFRVVTTLIFLQIKRAISAPKKIFDNQHYKRSRSNKNDRISLSRNHSAKFIVIIKELKYIQMSPKLV